MFARVFNKVFGEAKYVAISILAFVVLVVFLAWLPNLALVKIIPIGLVLALPQSIGWPQFVFLLIVAILFGISLSFSIYYLKHSRLSGLTSLSGLLFALLGVGCASCGSLILTPILGIAAGGFIAALPFRGGEFAVLGLALMLWSLYSLVKKIDNPYA